MRILHVIAAFHPLSSFGGPVSNVHAYAQGLLRRGHQVSVCCSDRLDLTTRVEVEAWDHGVSAPVLWDGIEVRYVRSFHLGRGSYGTTFSPALWPYLFRQVREYDVVHIHGTWSTFSLVAGIIAGLHRVPYVVQLHNTFPIRSHQVMLKRMLHALVRVRWLDCASAILALAPGEKEEYLARRPQDREKVFIVGSLLPPIPLGQRGNFRCRWGIPEEDCLVLYLGRLHRGKGLEYLIRSLQLVERKALRLVIVGPDAGYKGILEKAVKQLGLSDRVLFAGPIYGEDKYSVYRDADIFVLPSMFEQLPVSALEAARCELPLILSDRCGMTEMVIEAGAGIVIPYGSHRALAEAVQALCRNRSRRKKMGQNARTMVERCCDPGDVISGLEDIYQKAFS